MLKFAIWPFIIVPLKSALYNWVVCFGSAWEIGQNCSDHHIYSPSWEALLFDCYIQMIYHWKASDSKFSLVQLEYSYVKNCNFHKYFSEVEGFMKMGHFLPKSGSAPTKVVAYKSLSKSFKCFVITIDILIDIK